VSADLVTRIQLGLEELGTVREQLSPLIAKAKPPGSKADAIETARARLGSDDVGNEVKGLGSGSIKPHRSTAVI
jgi:hypothetical protein